MTCVVIAGVLMNNILYCTRIVYLVLCCNVKTLTLMDVNMSLEQETLNIMVVKINGFTVFHLIGLHPIYYTDSILCLSKGKLLHISIIDIRLSTLLSNIIFSVVSLK